MGKGPEEREPQGPPDMVLRESGIMSTTMVAELEKLSDGVMTRIRRSVGSDKSKNKHALPRLQVVLGESAVARLERLQEYVEPNTKTEVFRVALRLLEDVVSELDKGNEFLIKDKSGQVYPYKASLTFR